MDGPPWVCFPTGGHDAVTRAARSCAADHLPHNPQNGYTVARLTPERAGAEAEAARGDGRLVTVIGTLADLTPGEAIVAHGWQFMAVDYRAALPATPQGTRKYPGSGLV